MNGNGGSGRNDDGNYVINGGPDHGSGGFDGGAAIGIDEGDG